MGRLRRGSRHTMMEVNVQKLQDLLEDLGEDLETQPSISYTQEPQTTPCESDLPDGKRCPGTVQWIPRSSENAYSYVEPCPICKVDWSLHRAFGMLSHDRDAARTLKETIFERLKTPPVKTDANRAARDALRPLLNDPRGANGALLGGPVGTGKTFLGTHCLNAIIRRHHVSAMYFPEHKFVEAWRATHEGSNLRMRDWGENVMSNAKSAKVLMLDDFGQTRGLSPSAVDAVESLIMHRYDAGLKMIVTTNRSMDTLEMERGSRSVSRIIGMAGSLVMCGGGDWRRSE